MSRGRFHGRVRVVEGRLCRVFQAEANQSILTQGMDGAPFASFIPVTARSEATVWQGRQLAAGEVIVKGPEVPYDNRTPRNVVIRPLLVPVEGIEQAAVALTGRDLATPINSWTAIRPDPRALEALQQASASLLTAALAQPGLLDTPGGRVLESECLRRLIDVLAAPLPDRPTRHDPGHRARLVRRAVDFMHAHTDQTLTAQTLCLALGSTDRTLRRAFQETFGVGPLSYFRVIRLHAVRAELKSSCGTDATVADTARRWGFNRLGAFAGEYRLQFGEPPSETLGVRGRPGVKAITRLQNPR